MDFDIQTFYEQLGTMAELRYTTSLPRGTIYQIFCTDKFSFDVFIDLHEHKVIRINIRPNYEGM